MTATPGEMTIELLRAKWIGRKIYSSTDHKLHGNPPSRAVCEIWLNEEHQTYTAWSTDEAGGEHLRANSAEALDRRLESLAR